jgi:hypothetical protein
MPPVGISTLSIAVTGLWVRSAAVHFVCMNGFMDQDVDFHLLFRLAIPTVTLSRLTQSYLLCTMNEFYYETHVVVF